MVQAKDVKLGLQVGPEPPGSVGCALKADDCV